MIPMKPTKKDSEKIPSEDLSTLTGISEVEEELILPRREIEGFEFVRRNKSRGSENDLPIVFGKVEKSVAVKDERVEKEEIGVDQREKYEEEALPYDTAAKTKEVKGKVAKKALRSKREKQKAAKNVKKKPKGKGKGKTEKKGKGKGKKGKDKKKGKEKKTLKKRRAFGYEGKEYDFKVPYLAYEEEEISSRQQLVLMTEMQFRCQVEYFTSLLEEKISIDNYRMLQAGIWQLLGKYKACYFAETALRSKVKELVMESKTKDRIQNQLLLVLKDSKKNTAALRQELNKVRGYIQEVIRDKGELQIKLEQMKEEKQILTEELKQLQESPVTTRPDDKRDRDVTLENKALQTEIAKLTKDLTMRTKEKDDLTLDLTETAQKLAKAQNDFDIMRKKWYIELKKRSKAEKDVSSQKLNLQRKAAKIKKLMDQLDATKRKIIATKESVISEGSSYRKFIKKYEALNKAYLKSKRNYNISQTKFFKAQAQKTELMKKLNLTISEVQVLKKDIVEVVRIKSRLERMISALEHYKKQADEKIKNTKEDRDSLKAELEQMRIKNADINKQLEEVQHENIEHQEKIEQEDRVIRHLRYELRLKEEERENLRRELDIAIGKLDTYAKDLRKAELEEVELHRHINDLTIKCKEQKQSIEEYINCAHSSQKLIEEIEKKLASEHRSLVATTHKLNEFKNKFYKSEEQCLQLKRDFNRMNDIVNEFKEDDQMDVRKNMISYRAMDINLRKLMKERFYLKLQLSRANQEMEAARSSLRIQESSANHQRKEAMNWSIKCEHLQKQSNSLREENMRLTTLAASKDIEIKLLREKLYLQDAVLVMNKKECKKREKDIKLLKKELAQYVRIKGILEREVNKITPLKNELIHTQKQLREERMRGQVLETDMQHPINLHRWRVLEGFDPPLHQTIMKNQHLQSKVNKLMVEVEKKSKQLEDAHSETSHLKELLNNQCSLREIGEAMTVRVRCRKLNDKCQSLSAEVKMYESFCCSYKTEIQALKQELYKYKSRCESKQF